MPVLTIFSSRFCRKDDLVRRLRDTIELDLITDDDVIRKAAEQADMDVRQLQGAFRPKTSVFNKFTHEKERAIAWLRLALADMLSTGEDLLVDGFSSMLIPASITHVLRVCLIADTKYRLQRAQQTSGLDEKEASLQIHRADEERAAWIDELFKIQDPWAPSLYDILIPVDKFDPDAALNDVVENLRSEVIQPTDTSRRAMIDFSLASRVAVALAKEGHNVEVTARDGVVTITIHKNVLMLSRLEAELKGIAERVDGVVSVDTRIGKGFHRSDIYRKYDFQMPKLLLVDDEREFVHTLSERLQMRDMTSAVTYDGESALDLVDEDEPEVMILDLKMPGIDGIEVLRKVKQTRPEIEVIILTGHGSEADRETCMSLGAFAYLQKPVDFEVLTETLRKANAKMKQNRVARS
jgi:two-component system response regulator CpxR